jgi:cbb3-type cytochrome oxidase maturation protein
VNAQTLALLTVAVVMALAAAIPFTWAVLSGQFDDTESAKFRMLREEETP